MTLLNVLDMPWGGHRNLALREALGIQPGEIAMVDGWGQVQLVVDDLGRANDLARKVKAGAPYERVTVKRRPDGKHVVWAHNTSDATL